MLPIQYRQVKAVSPLNTLAPYQHGASRVQGESDLMKPTEQKITEKDWEYTFLTHHDTSIARTSHKVKQFIVVNRVR